MNTWYEVARAWWVLCGSKFSRTIDPALQEWMQATMVRIEQLDGEIIRQQKVDLLPEREALVKLLKPYLYAYPNVVRKIE